MIPTQCRYGVNGIVHICGRKLIFWECGAEFPYSLVVLAMQIIFYEPSTCEWPLVHSSPLVYPHYEYLYRRFICDMVGNALDYIVQPFNSQRYFILLSVNTEISIGDNAVKMVGRKRNSDSENR